MASLRCGSTMLFLMSRLAKRSHSWPTSVSTPRFEIVYKWRPQEITIRRTAITPHQTKNRWRVSLLLKLQSRGYDVGVFIMKRRWPGLKRILHRFFFLFFMTMMKFFSAILCFHQFRLCVCCVVCVCLVSSVCVVSCVCVCVCVSAVGFQVDFHYLLRKVHCLAKTGRHGQRDDSVWCKTTPTLVDWIMPGLSMTMRPPLLLVDWTMPRLSMTTRAPLPLIITDHPHP